MVRSWVTAVTKYASSFFVATNLCSNPIFSGSSTKQEISRQGIFAGKWMFGVALAISSQYYISQGSLGEGAIDDG